MFIVFLFVFLFVFYAFESSQPKGKDILMLQLLDRNGAYHVLGGVREGLEPDRDFGLSKMGHLAFI